MKRSVDQVSLLDSQSLDVLAPQDVSQKALQDVLASQDVTLKRQKIEILDVAVFTSFLQVFPAELAMHLWFGTTSLLSMTCRALRAMFSDYLPLYKTVRIYKSSVAEYKRDWILRYGKKYQWRPFRSIWIFTMKKLDIRCRLPLNY